MERTALATQHAGGKQPLHSNSDVRTEMKGVYLIVDPTVILEVRWLRGKLVPTRAGINPWFDDPSSFRVQIDQGEIAMTPASMTSLLNKYVFNGPDAPVEDLKIEIRDGRIHQEATLRKKVKIKSTIEGDLSVTEGGDIRLHPDKIKAEGLPVKGLLDLFDVELSEMIKSQASKGVTLDENDFILDPERLLPSPKIAGRVTAVHLEKDRIVQTFGGSEATPLKPAFPEAKHYLFYRGGELSFGKLTMHGADLQIIDADPKDPFQFYLKEYLKQLVAGTSKTMPDKGLVVYMPDYDEVSK